MLTYDRSTWHGYAYRGHGSTYYDRHDQLIVAAASSEQRWWYGPQAQDVCGDACDVRCALCSVQRLAKSRMGGRIARQLSLSQMNAREAGVVWLWALAEGFALTRTLTLGYPYPYP